MKKLIKVILIVSSIMFLMLIWLFAPSSTRFFNIFNPNDCVFIESKIKEEIKTMDLIYELRVNDLTDFHWDKLFILSGPRMEGEVSEIIGIEYESLIQDNRRSLIFMDGNLIAKEYLSSCNDFNWGRLNNKNGFVEIRRNELIKFQKRLIENEWVLYEATGIKPARSDITK